MRLRAWGLELPKSRADYDKMLKSVVRKELRRKRRNLDDEGQVRFVRAQSEAQGREFLETLRHQRQIRCVELGGFDILSKPPFSQFYESLIFENWTKGFGELSVLMVGQEIAASLFALRYRGHYLLLMHCFESKRWGTKSPGIVIIDSAITAEIEGNSKYFDFTVGNESYKFQFGVEEKVLYSLEQGLSPFGRVFAALRQTKSFVRKQLRRLPPEYLPRRLQE